MPSHEITRNPTRLIHAAHPPLAGFPSRWALGPMDYYLGPGIPIVVVFVYEAGQGGEEAGSVVPVHRLEKAMRYLLDSHPHFTGRFIAEAGEAKEPCIAQLGSGAALIEANSSARLDSFVRPEGGDYITTSFPPDLVPPYEPTAEYLAHNPFFAVQHTRFSCGGVALAIRMAHAVVDGEGFFSVVRDLATVYRQLSAGVEKPQLDHAPSIRPYMADWASGASEEEREEARSWKSRGYKLAGEDWKEGSNGVTQSTPVIESDSPPPDPDPVQGRVLRFSPTQLASLKQAALPHTHTEGQYITTFDALFAHLLQLTYRARSSPHRNPAAQPTICNFLTPSSWRARLGLPAHHTPNTCFVNFASLDPQEVLQGPVDRIATAVHSVSRGLSLGDAQAELRWLCAQRDKGRVQLAYEYGEGSLMLSAWHRMDVYAAGTLDDALVPAVVSTPFTSVSLVDGLGYFLPVPPKVGKQGEGAGIDVALALKGSVWREIDRALGKKGEEGKRSFTYVG
ncbi:hypothetical protein BDZ90DRAFT_86327 [Jaminaea rosea]|uniref:Transferase-domain-containing protein n=1 Tax=Jaminaea rosea TaxID=1569628 RepID=A0A316UK05_9BASI|nr:hypothetical protein BDZ90DRAFT_86327 [Jaminaea rosea]PWN25264.1 hypothetical protein BDZ90DRAFT_86327 [Jaminaea rosea]